MTLSHNSTRLNLGRSTIVLVVAALAMAVMTPRLLSAQFGLLDDGITIHVSRAFRAALGEGNLGFLFQHEAHRGRFRPLYWLALAGQYAIWGPSALGFFITNGLTLALTALFVAGAVAVTTRDRLASLITGVAYVLSPLVVESYYTLSKPEVPLALWLAVSLCCWAGARVEAEGDPKRSRWLFVASTVSLLFAYFTKETAQAVLLVSTLWVSVHRVMAGVTRSPRVERLDRWYLGVNLACTALFWIARGTFGTASIAAGDDSRHYALTGDTILSSSLEHIVWYARDFPLLLPLLAFLWWRAGHRAPRESWPALVAVFWIVAWTLIMLPWHSVHEYYLLPASLGVAVITGMGAASALRSLRAPPKSVRIVAGALLALMLLSWPLTFGNAVTNGRIQLAIDAANARLVDFLAATAPARGTVLVNIPSPNEYMEELALHLVLLKGRGDVKVEYGDRRAIRHDEAVLVATPIMRNQPFPSVRFAVSEPGTARWRDDLYARFGTRASLVYRDTERVRLFVTQIQKPICDVLVGPRMRREFFCASRPRLLDTRTFVYGWEVYQAHAT